MTTQSTETRWRGIVLGAAMILVGGLGAACAWGAREGVPAAAGPSGTELARELRSITRSDRVVRRHTEVHRERRDRSRDRSGDPWASWREAWGERRIGEDWGRFGERMGRQVARRGDRVGERWGRLGERVGERWGERIGEHWGRFGERMGEHWGEFGERTGERWGEFGERTGERWSRVGASLGDRFGERGDDLPGVIELSIETVYDALETVLESLGDR